jgi:DNA-binding MarR family transcriptional regulator/ribosomal protein S18 acetylase RimI-like enzyme
MSLDEHIDAVRRFNRFYTQRVGALRKGLLDSPFPLPEARLLYELAHRTEPTASELCADLGMDAGYLSRILRGLGDHGLVVKSQSQTDGRRNLLRLTRKGRLAAEKLNAASHAEIAGMLGAVETSDQERLVGAMRTIERLLGGQREIPRSFVIRDHRPGDLGWIVSRHGALYAQEYGWDGTFEGLVAEIIAGFGKCHDPAMERCWVAEANGEKAGSILLVRQSPKVAKLRLLLVEPAARGMGVGRALVMECIRFAERAGYIKIRLWANSNLDAARHIYQGAGFALIKEEPHQSFGKNLVGQIWELKL